MVEAQAAALRGTLNEAGAKVDSLTIARNGYLELTARPADADRLFNKLAARVAEIRVGFRDLARRFDRERMHVLYDLPPLQAMESVVEAAAAVGNVMLVVRIGHTRCSDLKQITATLTACEMEIRAVVITTTPRELLADKPAFGPPAQRPRLWRKHRDSGADKKPGRIVVGDDVPIV